MDIVDVVVGERGPEADVNLLRKQQPNFSDEPNFQGDKAYISRSKCHGRISIWGETGDRIQKPGEKNLAFS